MHVCHSCTHAGLEQVQGYVPVALRPGGWEQESRAQTKEAAKKVGGQQAASESMLHSHDPVVTKPFNLSAAGSRDDVLGSVEPCIFAFVCRPRSHSGVHIKHGRTCQRQ